MIVQGPSNQAVAVPSKRLRGIWSGERAAVEVFVLARLVRAPALCVFVRLVHSSEHEPPKERLGNEGKNDVHEFTKHVLLPLADTLVYQNHIDGECVEEQQIA